MQFNQNTVWIQNKPVVVSVVILQESLFAPLAYEARRRTRAREGMYMYNNVYTWGKKSWLMCLLYSYHVNRAARSQKMKTLSLAHCESLLLREMRLCVTGDNKFFPPRFAWVIYEIIVFCTELHDSHVNKTWIKIDRDNLIRRFILWASERAERKGERSPQKVSIQ